MCVIVMFWINGFDWSTTFLWCNCLDWCDKNFSFRNSIGCHRCFNCSSGWFWSPAEYYTPISLAPHLTNGNIKDYYIKVFHILLLTLRYLPIMQIKNKTYWNSPLWKILALFCLFTNCILIWSLTDKISFQSIIIHQIIFKRFTYKSNTKPKITNKSIRIQKPNYIRCNNQSITKFW